MWHFSNVDEWCFKAPWQSPAARGSLPGNFNRQLTIRKTICQAAVLPLIFTFCILTLIFSESPTHDQQRYLSTNIAADYSADFLPIHECQTLEMSFWHFEIIHLLYVDCDSLKKFQDIFAVDCLSQYCWVSVCTDIANEESRCALPHSL